jgi:hypothetical protein
VEEECDRLRRHHLRLKMRRSQSSKNELNTESTHDLILNDGVAVNFQIGLLEENGVAGVVVESAMIS